MWPFGLKKLKKNVENSKNPIFGIPLAKLELPVNSLEIGYLVFEIQGTPIQAIP